MIRPIRTLKDAILFLEEQRAVIKFGATNFTVEVMKDDNRYDAATVNFKNSEGEFQECVLLAAQIIATNIERHESIHAKS